MKREKPPFRADHVGSILRTSAIKDARATREKGEITAADLKQVEDREIEKIIRKQEEIGLQLATDGEYRRSWWHPRFLLGARRLREDRARARDHVQGSRDAAGRLPHQRQA